MSSRSTEVRPNQILIHAPYGRDAALLHDVFCRAGMQAEICRTLDELCAGLADGAAAILVGDEALNQPALEKLIAILKQQPPWSDVPIFVMLRLTATGSRHSFLKRFEGLGNVSLINRPLRSEMIVSAFRMALRARDRQYEIRDFVEAERRSTSALARANVELKHANDDLSQFAYSASHDLQEPLRMVSIYTQLLQRQFGTTTDSTAGEFMKFIIDGAKRMEELLKDLLSYLQVVNADDDEESVTDVGRCLQQALENLQQLIKESGAVIECGKMPEVAVKPVHMLQLFQNLIGNALKYRSDAQPTIVISAEYNNHAWRIDVRDNGIGIDPMFAQQIFGVFKRLHSAHTYSGTGIGLAICQKIVERYGGRIWVESEGPGRGSTFSFTLPALTAT